MTAPTRTSLVPPRLVSLPVERAQLEYSSRALVFSSDGDRLLRAWGPPERPWVLSVEAARDRWAIEAWGAGPAAARSAVRSLFSLDHPIEQFYRRTREEPVLRGTERRFRGLRLPRDANLYEALVHTIVGQQISVAAANAIKGRLIERFGGVLRAGRLTVPCLPPPSRLRREGVEGLRSVGLSAAKSRSLVALASAGSRSLPSVARLRSSPLPEARAVLERLPGVGRWTAENALLRGAGRTDVFVAGDLGLRHALDRYGVVPRGASEESARAWGERWYPGWGSYATLYLWRALVADRAGSDRDVGGAVPSRTAESVR
ncbi:MAG TPA: hypothetical protein VML94_05630 [Thermoplasmata archaeon]|nr:hypothetical protein [Thermoplasmata archaeon]